MEGRTFACTWTREGDGFVAWVKARPHVRARAAAFEIADEQLALAICAQLGDCENSREYLPPPPVRGGVGIDLHRAVLVGANATARILNPGELFSEPPCPVCGRGRGYRTESPLVVDAVEGEGGCAQSGKIRLTFFSERFLDRLTTEERATFEWRPVTYGRARIPRYEMVPRQPPIPFVPIAGVDDHVTECPECGHRSIPFRVRERVLWYVDAVAIPAGTMFPLGEAGWPHLGVRRSRWDEILEHRVPRGVRSYVLGVAAAGRVDRAPRVRRLARKAAPPT